MTILEILEYKCFFSESKSKSKSKSNNSKTKNNINYIFFI